MKNLHLVGLVLLAFSLPFAYINIWRDIQFAYFSLPVIFFIFSIAQQPEKSHYYRFWRVFVLWLTICTLVGFLLDQRFDLRQIKLIFALVICTMISEKLAHFIRRSTLSVFIDAVVIAFTINLVISIFVGYEIRHEISRISSFQSIGYSEYGLNEIGGQASFNEFGAMSGVCALLALMQLQLHRNSAKKLILYGLLFLSSCYQVLLTGSRSALIATFIGVMLFCYLTRNAKLALVALLVIVGGIYFSDIGNSVIIRFENTFIDSFSNDAQSALGRIDGILDGFQLFLDNPVFGVGYGGYSYASGSGLVTSENYFVQLLAESGFIGLFLFLFFLFELDLERRQILAIDHSADRIILINGIASGLAILVISNLSGTSFFDTSFMLFFVVFSMALKSLAPTKSNIGGARSMARSV